MKIKKLRKLIALGLVAAMMFSMAGCGGDTKEAAESVNKQDGESENPDTIKIV